jgi:heptosyltransferase-2
MKGSERIVVTRTDRLGDVVLSTPVIKHLRKLFPDAYIAFMVRPENRGVVSADGHLNEVIVYDKYGLDDGIAGMFRIAGKLKRRRFDISISLHPDARVHLALFLAGIPRRIGYDRKMPLFLTERYTHRKQKGMMHEVDYNLDLLGRAGFDTGDTDRMPYIHTDYRVRLFVDRMMKDRGLGDDLAVIHPGASCPSKRWPAERFAAVADEVSSRTGCQIVLVGGEGTEAFSEKVINDMRNRAVDLTGTLRIAELAELISRSRVFISNDSGPVHVAAAVKTPCVVIFGRNDPGLSPRRWGPVGEKVRVHHKPPACDICLAHECENGFECLQAVTPDEVTSSVLSIVE